MTAHCAKLHMTLTECPELPQPLGDNTAPGAGEPMGNKAAVAPGTVTEVVTDHHCSHRGHCCVMGSFKAGKSWFVAAWACADFRVSVVGTSVLLFVGFVLSCLAHNVVFSTRPRPQETELSHMCTVALVAFFCPTQLLLRKVVLPILVGTQDGKGLSDLSQPCS